MMNNYITENTESIRIYLAFKGYTQLSITKNSYKWIIIGNLNNIPVMYEVTTRYANRKHMFELFKKVTNEELKNII